MYKFLIYFKWWVCLILIFIAMIVYFYFDNYYSKAFFIVGSILLFIIYPLSKQIDRLKNATREAEIDLENRDLDERKKNVQLEYKDFKKNK